jgi:hypothetical protein
MSKILSSNIFWGRRSGSLYKGKGQNSYRTLSFVQMQFGAGTSGQGRKLNTELKGVNKKWFHGYKNTVDVYVKAKGQK